MKTLISGRQFKVKQTGNKFFYWSPRAVRWLPVAKDKVIFEEENIMKVNVSAPPAPQLPIPHGYVWTGGVVLWDAQVAAYNRYSTAINATSYPATREILLDNRHKFLVSCLDAAANSRTHMSHKSKDLKAITEELLLCAADIADDAIALSVLQDAAGITDGDCAAAFFAGTDIAHLWPMLNVGARLAWLRRYVAFENAMGS